MAAPTPRRIQTANLPSSLRGYDREATDRLLRDVAAGYEEVWLERKALREQVQQLQAQMDDLRTRERAVGEALVAAERTADEIRSEAQREADAIVEQARAEREQLEKGVVRLRELIEKARSDLSPLLTDMLDELNHEDVAPIVEQDSRVEGDRSLLEDITPSSNREG